MDATAAVGGAIVVAIALIFVIVELATEVDWSKLAKRVKRD